MDMFTSQHSIHLDIQNNGIAIAEQDLLYGCPSPTHTEASETLFPRDFQWTDFGTISVYTPPAASPLTSPTDLTPPSYLYPDPTQNAHMLEMMKSSETAAPTSSRRRPPNHIPRPRNAFMLFRCAFLATQKISANIEHDHRHISRIIAHCWNRLSDSDKQIWRDKAAAEKELHAQKYPNYRFSPVGRVSKPIKRKVRRNGKEDKKRCEQVAELLLAGKQGNDLETAVKEIDISTISEASAEVGDRDDGEAVKNRKMFETPINSDGGNLPPFRSPLLPPARLSALTQLQSAIVQSAIYPSYAVPLPLNDRYPGTSYYQVESTQIPHSDVAFQSVAPTQYPDIQTFPDYNAESSVIHSALSGSSNNTYISSDFMDSSYAYAAMNSRTTPYTWTAPTQFNNYSYYYSSF